MAESVTVARPYAQAVFNLAKEKGALPVWSDRLGRLALIASDPEMTRVIGNPKFSVRQTADLFRTLSGEQSDRELAAADKRFPHNPPQTKEAYFYRSLFAQFYPSQAAAETVPGGKSIACSSPAAIAWDASFATMADPSGRAVAGVHAQAVAAV